MRIPQLYRQKPPVFSIELFPPKTEKGIESLKEKLAEICAHEPDFISVTYGAGGGTRHTTLEICNHIKNTLQTEVMAHLTCAAHSRQEIQHMVSALKERKVENIMALRGDPPKGADSFVPAADGFQYAIDLVRAITARGGFGIGVAGYPEGHTEAVSYQADLKRQVDKINAGGQVIISQFFLDNGHFLKWRDDLRRSGVNVPIVPGILPAISHKQISGFANMCGVSVPRALLVGLERYEEHPESAAAFGLMYAIRQIEALLKEDLDGLHLYALNRLEPIRMVGAMLHPTENPAGAFSG